jgi:hypothetical protein
LIKWALELGWLYRLIGACSIICLLTGGIERSVLLGLRKTKGYAVRSETEGRGHL